MAQREWVEKDFYKELGVSSDAARRRSSGLPQAARREPPRPEPRQRPPKTVQGGLGGQGSAVGSGQAQGVRRNPKAVRQRRFRSPVGYSGGGGGFGGSAATAAEFNLNDLFDAAGQTGGANIGDLFGGLFGRGAQQPRPSRPRRGNDLETETELSFLEATKGVAMPLRLTSPAPCTNCHGSGARPGTSPKVCPNCNGVGRDQPQPGCVRLLRAVHRMPRAAARSSSTRATSARAPA